MIQSPPLLTIITVCYNAATTIRPTLESIAQQTCQDFEYLVIDGASTDDTLEFVRNLYSQAHILSESDHGLYDAMNKGLRLAQGVYIWYLNAGDKLRTPYTIQHVLDTLKQESYPSILYGDTMIVDGHYEDQHLRRLRPPRQLTSNSFQQGMLICHQAFIPRRELAPLYDERYRLSADYDWCIRIIDRAERAVFLDEVLVSYLNDGMTTRHHRASLLERFRIMRYRYGLTVALWRHLTFVFRALFY